MTETKDFSELYITENTLDEILATMSDPLPIVPDKRPEIIERLRELYLAVHIEHRLAPMNTRTKLDKTLKPLLRQSLDLQRRIGDDEIQWMNKILSITALDLYVQSKKAGALSKKDTYIPPQDILERTEQSLSDFSKLLSHLCNMMDQFDELEPKEYPIWIGNAGTEREMYIRNEIVPHFRKRGGIGPDATAVRRISEIYEFAFERPFSINPREPYERGDVDSSNQARYSGRSVKFACAVVKALKIDGIIVPLTDKYLADTEPDADKSKLDLSALSRERAFAGEAAAESWLINRIGDLWINDSRRQEKAVAK
ncbi:hypothetical protein JQ620_09005 [Bradyrhizobium sp. AUGA SZCCT0274]|uniref:hypothetical protein n=1 Tax=Bradyrhizobium sp. AUGA SZCCT0274 TaxID=2807670 RepID=UPI001BAB3B5E|nr:hypothetical protein [Bradyrhizobium sp. AUGA SZCCT0274]MBR1240261.1 hypothetical protein [Bradyrhizobium sp. AUGA SZCCT0274]